MSEKPLFGATPRQTEIPFARVRGEPYYEIPADLYIPPEALEVILDAFEGPLDLLLYLIRRQNLDILDIPIAEITRQYIGYIEMMRVLKLELAAEYLVMAAMLAEIKSRLLLPKPPAAESEDADPRAELVRRLQEYERYKEAAQALDALPRLERDTAVARAEADTGTPVQLPPKVELRELLQVFRELLQRAELYSSQDIEREPLSVRQRMSELLARLTDGQFHPFDRLIDYGEGRRGLVVSFLALLELAREQLIDLVQDEPGRPIYVRSLALRTG